MEIGAQKIHPTQLYSVLSLLTLFAVLLILERYMKFPGQLFLFAVILYGVHRFLIDFLRYYTPDERMGALATSQVVSILAVAVALTIMIVLLVRWRSRTRSTKVS